MGQIISAKELNVYRKAYDLAMRMFQVSGRFPADERYALTSQIRRSSRSVCLNLREAWAKRRHAAHFASKLTDCDGETVPRSSRARPAPPWELGYPASAPKGQQHISPGQSGPGPPDGLHLPRLFRGRPAPPWGGYA